MHQTKPPVLNQNSLTKSLRFASFRFALKKMSIIEQTIAIEEMPISKKETLPTKYDKVLSIVFWTLRTIHGSGILSPESYNAAIEQMCIKASIADKALFFETYYTETSSLKKEMNKLLHPKTDKKQKTEKPKNIDGKRGRKAKTIEIIHNVQDELIDSLVQLTYQPEPLEERTQIVAPSGKEPAPIVTITEEPPKKEKTKRVRKPKNQEPSLTINPSGKEPEPEPSRRVERTLNPSGKEPEPEPLEERTLNPSGKEPEPEPSRRVERTLNPSGKEPEPEPSRRVERTLNPSGKEPVPIVTITEEPPKKEKAKRVRKPKNIPEPQPEQEEEPSQTLNTYVNETVATEEKPANTISNDDDDADVDFELATINIDGVDYLVDISSYNDPLVSSCLLYSDTDPDTDHPIGSFNKIYKNVSLI